MHQTPSKYLENGIVYVKHKKARQKDIYAEINLGKDSDGDDDDDRYNKKSWAYLKSFRTNLVYPFITSGRSSVRVVYKKKANKFN